jgi:hypothetical protein
MPKSAIKEIILSILLLSSLPLHALEHEEHEHEQHQAHVHGKAELLVAVDFQDLEIVFHSPAINLIGFEHPPETQSEIKQLATAENILQQVDILFILPPEAGCSLQQLNIQLPFEKQSKENHAGHENDSHADFSCHYHYKCQSSARLTGFKAGLFDQFPLLEEIHGQAISGRGQHAFELHPDKNSVDL